MDCRYRALFREFDEGISSIESVLNILSQSSSLFANCGSALGTDRTQPKKKYFENIFLDVGVNPQELTPYGPGLYFQLEAINLPQNRGSKSNPKSEPEIFFHTLAHGGHFDQLIQKYRSPSMATGGLLLAFGVRFSLTRLQELFCTASTKNPATALQRITTNVFDSSSLPIILVVSDMEYPGGDYMPGVEGKRLKLPELTPAHSQTEVSYHAEIAVVLHVLHLSGLRAAQSLHQLQRDIQRINRGMMIEPIRNDNHFTLLVQIASSHGVHFIVAPIHGREIKNNVTNNMETAVRVFLPDHTYSSPL